MSRYDRNDRPYIRNDWRIEFNAAINGRTERPKSRHEQKARNFEKWNDKMIAASLYRSTERYNWCKCDRIKVILKISSWAYVLAWCLYYGCLFYIGPSPTPERLPWQTLKWSYKRIHTSLRKDSSFPNLTEKKIFPLPL
jgi:hypothetical protein